MKRIFSLLLAALMLLSLAACAQSNNNNSSDPATLSSTQGSSTTPTDTPTAAPTNAPTEQVTDESAPELGGYQDGVYTNAFLGLRCEFADNWYIYSSEELAQLNGLVADSMTDEDFANLIRNSGAAFSLYALDNTNGYTININLEDLGMLYGTILSEEAYAEAAVPQLPDALESIGMTDITIDVSSTDFAGEPHTMITVHGYLQGIDFYEVVVCKKVGSYIANITVGSYYEDKTSELLNMFTPYNP